MCTFNNNYRIQSKANGATILTLGPATFWNPVITNKALLGKLTDPRCTFDPINSRWIVASQTTNNPGQILFGVSQNADPAGNWFLYSVTLGGSYLIDFPTLGFNKNWICVSINQYNSTGTTFTGGVQVVADYGAARAGTLSGVSTFTGAGTRFCAAPCVTVSATEDTLFVPTHLGSMAATFQVDVITGTPSTPVYTSGASQVRPGGVWTQPSGNQLPQSVPNAGTSACNPSPPCPIEAQDAQIRSAPIYRVDATTGRGYIYYTQSIRLTTPTNRNSVQWTKLTAALSAGAPSQFADGGRIDDAAGVNWYAFPSIAVNQYGDFLLGYSQFGSGIHPSAAYSVHVALDGLGTLRDPFIYKAGEDYYHKTFSTTTGRNRWGDFTTAQVDPSDDRTLWVLQEYGKNRVGADDGNTGSNGSKWASYWASVGTLGTYTITATPGPNGAISPGGAVSVPQGGSQTFNILPNACYQTSDVVVDGSSVGTPASYSFTNVQANHTISASFSQTSVTITSSAGAHGSISPLGATPVPCGSNQSYTITPDPNYVVSELLIDSAPVTPSQNYTFNNVTAPHTIDASFDGPVAVEDTPAHFALGPVIPNPMRRSAQVTFGLATAAKVRVSIVDLQGRELALLAEGSYPAGWHVATWNGRTAGNPAGSGLYFMRYQLGSQVLTRKFTLTR